MSFRHKGLDDLIDKGDVIANRLVIAIVVSGILIGSSLIGISAKGGLHLFGISIFALLGFLAAAALSVVLVASIVRNGRL